MLFRSRFEKPSVKFLEGNADLVKSKHRRGKLLSALYAIRKAVSHASVSSGVSDLLADMAHWDKIIEFDKVTAGIKDYSPSEEMLTEQWNDLVKEENGQNAYHRRRESIEVSLISKDDVAEAIANLANARIEKQKVSDMLLDLNVKTEIEITDEHIHVLKANSLI